MEGNSKREKVEGVIKAEDESVEKKDDGREGRRKRKMKGRREAGREEGRTIYIRRGRV